MAQSTEITAKQIKDAFIDAATRTAFPPVMSPTQFAKLLGISKSTVYFWIAQGRLDGAARRRGKHQFIWRDAAIEQIFSGPEWRNDAGR